MTSNSQKEVKSQTTTIYIRFSIDQPKLYLNLIMSEWLLKYKPYKSNFELSWSVFRQRIQIQGKNWGVGGRVGGGGAEREG